MTNTNTKHAVLFFPDDGLSNMAVVMIEGNAWKQQELVEPCRSLIDLAELALSHRVTHLWVTQNIGGFLPQENAGAYSFQINYRHGKMQTVSIWKRGKGKVTIIFAHHTSWPQAFINASPKEKLVTIAYLEEKLGVEVTGSPAGVGWAYLKKLHPDWIEDVPEVNLKDCHFDAHAARSFVWQRPLLSIERRKKYLHKFDKNADYPAAGASTDIGTGTPVHLAGKDADAASQHEKGHPQEVGVWLCTITAPAIAPANMPAAWDKDAGWLAGPLIRLLRKTGHTVEVREGWVFPQRHDVLVKWAQVLWAIRGEFKTGTFTRPQCAKLAYACIKQIANSTIGMTAYRGFEDEDVNEKKRPDIRVQVIARSRELIYHNIDKVRVMYGVTPVMVYSDALYYLSDEPDGRAFLPELVKRETALGGYKYEGRIEVTPEVLAMLDEKMSVSKRLEVLNKKGWVK